MKALTSRFFLSHLIHSQTAQYGCRDSGYNLEFEVKLWNPCAAQTIKRVLGGNNVCLGNLEETSALSIRELRWNQQILVIYL